ncbi:MULTISPECIES: hypothetical protein [Chromobacterium]|uniref:Head-tail adaptor protein n=1 Tax=Chromobacterium phragmitis TaxID=2202141 RepID=A0ABV0J0Z0_9NEIS|nr:hypothetical protein [Chromobacterium sp. ASV23]
MFFPKNTCKITRLTQERDLFGKSKGVEKSWEAKCSVVRLLDGVGKSTVRADSSGSRGFAEEETLVGRLLLLPQADVQNEDIIEVVGRRMRVACVFPRFDVMGKLDHLQVDCVAWASKLTATSTR